ncbi:MAG: LpxI family protein [Candidatus Omnitrophica bacterium]|nr:LpxI family protein [Candidatus Omnitrophota bacterium]
MTIKLGILAGNRSLPLVIAQSIKRNKECKLVAICFKGETHPSISKYADKTYWICPGHLGALRNIIKNEDLKEWTMAGQISPWRIFKPKYWDKELSALIERINDFRPHNIFYEVINYLEGEGVKFLDSTIYLKDYLSESGLMSQIPLANEEDVNFGVDMISRFVELDLGQTIVVKERSVVAVESLEGTDNTIRRGGRIAGFGCTVLKFCKCHQDFRFDVPVVGLSTLKLLKKIKASGIVLESGKVIILEKDRFLSQAKKLCISVMGKERC